MYVTAHRAVSRAGDEGINAFLHLHGEAFPWPDDALPLPTRDPGKEVDSRVELAQVGDRVRAYLDVLAPDGTPWSDVQRALDLLRTNLDVQLNPAIFRVPPVLCVFGVEFGLSNEREQQFDRLRAALDQVAPREA